MTDYSPPPEAVTTPADLYFEDEFVRLYCGRLNDVLPVINVTADLVLTDPPYGETSIEWDRWPEGWPTLVAQYAPAMWMFGSARMFDEWRDDILGGGWKFSHDIVWRKPHASTGGVTDRFLRSHEHARHYYLGKWSEVYHEQQRVFVGVGKRTTTQRQATGKKWHGHRNASEWTDDGTRAMLTVLESPSVRGGIHPTEKPTGILEPLIQYGCPPGGLVLDPFAGSGSTLVAARATGRRAVGIELRPEQCEATAKRLAQGDLFGGVA
ncbi:MAG TPA: site-specific DNA-methyltransferase [Nocardioides sp.]|nr:site-specific DNA-methyltransferase [Nocardioides sp.]